MPKLEPLRFAAADVTIQAAEGDGAKKTPARFDVTAYTGGLMRVENYKLPVVVDLAGMQPGKNIVANLDHVKSQRVGTVSDYDNSGTELHLGGFASAATAARDEVVASAADGFVWQASIEASPTKAADVQAGDKAQINGQTFVGPFTWIKASVLKGFAFLGNGADDNTTVSIAATAVTSIGARTMQLEAGLSEFVTGLGFDPQALTDNQLAALEASYKGQKPPPKKVVASATSGELDEVLAKARADGERVQCITTITEQFLQGPRGRNNLETIEAASRLAIDNGWDADKFELELHRLTQPRADQFVTRSSARDAKISATLYEAAVCKAGGLDSSTLEKKYGEQMLDQVDEHFRSGIRLNQLVCEVAKRNGYTGNAYMVTPEIQSYAFGLVPQIRAAFSSVNLSGILSNAAHKFLLEGWGQGDTTLLRIASKANHTNMLEWKSYRLSGNLTYQRVSATGEIKQGSLGEKEYANKVDSYAIGVSVTDEDYINDNLGAITGTPRELGIGAIDSLNEVGWAEFMDNSSFFASGNNNVITGGTSALALTGLDLASSKFAKQTKPNGKPLSVRPDVLLVPSELENTADTLMTSEFVVGSTGPTPDRNTFRGKYRVESSPYLSNSSFTGYSAIAWYLLCSTLPVIQIAYLNGQETPTIEQAQVAFNMLGFQMRGVHRFGIRKQEYRGGVRAAGT